MKFYIGSRRSLNGGQPARVINLKEDGTILSCEPLSPEASQKRENHSQDFNWGYSGSGSAQLALAILLDATNEETARKFYCDFQYDIVSRWGDKWQISYQEIKDWLTQQRGGVVVQVESN